MHFTSVVTAHVRHSVRNTRPYSAQRNHVGHRDDSRSRPISLSHRRGVAAHLLGIGRTETCDRVGMDGPLGRAEIDAWPRLVVEMPVAVGAPPQHRGQPGTAGARTRWSEFTWGRSRLAVR